MITSLVLGAVLGTGGQHHRHHSHAPRWFDPEFATGDLAGGSYDPKTGFMMFAGGDCDGAITYAVLTADRYEMAKQGYAVPNFHPMYNVENGTQKMAVRHLPLRTRKGVRIGESESQLVARFGKPHKTHLDGWRKQFRVYEYAWHRPTRGEPGDRRYVEGRDFMQTYTFKKGRLIEIHLDSYSDQE